MSNNWDDRLSDIEPELHEIRARLGAVTVGLPTDSIFSEAREQQLVALVVEFVNASDKWDLARTNERFRDWSLMPVSDRSPDESDDEWAGRQPFQIAERARTQIALIAKERSLEGSRYADPVRRQLAEAGPSLVLQAGIRLDKSGELEHYALVHASLETAVQFAVSFLASRRKPYYSQIRQCSLPECGRFFLAHRVGKGKPPTKYCPDRNCKTKHHSRLSGAERTRRSRAKIDSSKAARGRVQARKPK